MGISIDNSPETRLVEKGLTGPELAEKLGVPANTLKSWGTRYGQTKESHEAIGAVPPWRYDKKSRRWFPEAELSNDSNYTEDN
jgi:uncharacterized protein YjcR